MIKSYFFNLNYLFIQFLHSSVLRIKYMQAIALKTFVKYTSYYDYEIFYLTPDLIFYRPKPVIWNVDRLICNKSREKRHAIRIKVWEEHPTHCKNKTINSPDEILVHTLTLFIHNSSSNHSLYKISHSLFDFWIACIQIVFRFLFCYEYFCHGNTFA